MLVYERTLPASPELVFACMTEPRHLAEFWGPTGTSTPLDGIVVELRVGGRFETLMVSDRDATTHRMRAIFSEVDPPQRVAWTEIDSGTTTTVTFVPDGETSTRMRIVQRHVPPEWREPDARRGFASSLDKFEQYLGTIPHQEDQ